MILKDNDSFSVTPYPFHPCISQDSGYISQWRLFISQTRRFIGQSWLFIGQMPGTR